MLGIKQVQIYNFKFNTLVAIKAAIDGKDGDRAFCVETKTEYVWLTLGSAYTANDEDVLITGVGGNTRWIGCAGKYTNVDYKFSSTGGDTNWTRVLTDVTPLNAGDNVDIGTGGLKDNDVTGAVMLGDSGNTAFSTTNKTIIGSVNELDTDLNALTTQVAGKTFYTVRAATTANIALTGEQTIDGVVCITGDRVLRKSQTNAAQNGIFVVAVGAWTRATDFDSEAEIKGSLVVVQYGAVNANCLFHNTNNGAISLETSLITFENLKDDTELVARSIYISTTGNDATGDGLTVGTAFFSLHKAFSTIKRNIVNCAITIYAGLGTYDYSSLGNLAINVTCIGTGNFIVKPNVALASRFTVVESSSTFTSNTDNIHTDSGKTWTVDQHMGNFVSLSSMLSGSLPSVSTESSNRIVPIIKNSATELHTSYAGTSLTQSQDFGAYEIISPATIFNFGTNNLYMPSNISPTRCYFYQVKILAAKVDDLVRNGTRDGQALTLYNSSVATTGVFSSNYSLFQNSYISASTISKINWMYSCAVVCLNELASGQVVADYTASCVFRNTAAGTSCGCLSYANTVEYKRFLPVAFAKFYNYKNAIVVSYPNSLRASTAQFSFDTVTNLMYVSGADRNVIIASGAITLLNEPTNARLTFDNTNPATEYYNSRTGFNCLAIAPDQYKTVNTVNDCYNATGSTIAEKTVVKLAGTLTNGVPNITAVTAVTDIPYGILEEALLTATLDHAVVIGKVRTANDYSLSAANNPIYFTAAGALSTTDTGSPIIGRVATTSGTTDSIHVDFTGISSGKKEDLFNRSGTDITPVNAGDNIDLGTGGLKDNDVTNAVMLGSATSTSFKTTAKDIIGSGNELYDTKLQIMSVNTTWNVASTGGDYTTLRAALLAAKSYWINSDVLLTIQLAGEVFAAEVTPIYIQHPCGDRISIVGADFTSAIAITSFPSLATSSFTLKVPQAGFPADVVVGMTSWLAETVVGNDSLFGAHTINSITDDGAAGWDINCGITAGRNYLTTTPSVNGTVTFQKTVLQFTGSSGIIIRDSNKLRQAKNFTVKGTKTASTQGFYILEGGSLNNMSELLTAGPTYIETGLAALNFTYGFNLARNAMAYLYKSCANNNTTYGYSSYSASSAFAPYGIACNNNIAGITADSGTWQSMLLCNNTFYGMCFVGGRVSINGTKARYNGRGVVYEAKTTLVVSSTTDLSNNTYGEMSPGISEKGLLAGVTSNIGQAPEQPYRYVRLASVQPETLANLVSGYTFDGVVLNSGDIILLKDQATASTNGLYTIGTTTPVRDVASNYVAMNLSQRLIHVSEGTVNAGKLFQNTNTSTITIGVTDLTYVEKPFLWSRTGTVITPYTAGDDINIGTGGLKDNDVTSPISLGDSLNTAFNTTNKTIVGAVNELDSDLTSLTTQVSGKTYYTVRAATTGNIVLTGEQTIDGIVCVTGDRVLRWKQTDAAENGIYIVAVGAWTRATDYNSEIEIKGSIITVQYGAINGGAIVSNLNFGSIILDTTLLSFSCLNFPILSGESVSRTIYLATTGSDITGDGTVSFPYYSPQRALKDIKSIIGVEGLTGVNISIAAAAGTYDYSSLPILEIDKSLIQYGSGTRIYLTTSETVRASALNILESGNTFDTLTLYSAITEYSIGDKVLYNEVQYISKTSLNTGNTPDILNSDHWSEVSNICYRAGAGWTPNAFVGNFVYITGVQYGTIPSETDFNSTSRLSPILRNGTDWIEIAWLGNIRISTYEIVSHKTIMNFGSKKIGFRSGFDTQIRLIEIITTNNLVGTLISNSTSAANNPAVFNSKITCSYVDLPAGAFSRSYIRSTTTSSGNTLYALTSSIIQTENTSTTTVVNVYRGYITNSILRKTTTTKIGYQFNNAPGTVQYFSMFNKNKIIGADAAIAVAGDIFPTYTCKLFLESVKFAFASTPSTTVPKNTNLIISSFDNTTILFDSEPTIGRLTFNNSTAATEYFNLAKSVNALAIAPTQYNVIKYDTHENTDVDSAAPEVVDSFSDLASYGVRWDIVIRKGSTIRMSSINAAWDYSTNTIQFSDEYATVNIGDTSDVTLSVDINSDLVRLIATTLSDNWIVTAQRYLV